MYITCSTIQHTYIGSSILEQMEISGLFILVVECYWIQIAKHCLAISMILDELCECARTVGSALISPLLVGT
jgi:hypothetical protein